VGDVEYLGKGDVHVCGGLASWAQGERTPLRLSTHVGSIVSQCGFPLIQECHGMLVIDGDGRVGCVGKSPRHVFIVYM